jgi:Zn-dependent protease
MFSSLKLGRFFGIDVYLHWSFWLIPLIAFWQAFQLGGPLAALVAVSFVLAAFACIVLHEYGHALTARRFGIPTRDITLYPIGGVARLARLGNNAWEEFLIALAGPTVNVVIAVILAGVLMLLAGANAAWPWDVVSDLVGELLIANLIFVVFNLIPAFPMDGGRIFRALLVPSKGYLHATEIAAWTGQLFAILFVLAGLLTLIMPVPYISWLLIPVGFFVWSMGQQELMMVRWRELQRVQASHGFHNEQPGTAQPVDHVVVKPVEARAGGFTGYLWDEPTGRWIEWQNGRPAHGTSMGP